MRDAFKRILDWFVPGTTDLEEDDIDFAQPRSNEESPPFQRLASFLPYTAFDAERRLFVIEADEPGKPEGWGFVLELSPQIGATKEMADFLVNLFAAASPAGTGFQIQIYGSPDLEALYESFLASTVPPEKSPYPQQASLLRDLARRRVEFYRRAATTELFSNVNYRVRSFRCNLSVVVPTTDLSTEASKREVESLRQRLINTLNQYHLFAHEWGPEDLINYVAQLLNPHRTLTGDHPWLEYDESKELRHQIIAQDTRAVESQTEIVFTGANKDPIAIRALSVRSYPSRFGLHNMAQLLGSATSSAIAYPCPFVITLGVAIPPFDAAKNTTVVKAARAQQTADSPLARYMPFVQDINQDWQIAQRAFDEGKGTCTLYHQILLLAAPDDLVRAEEAARAVWRSERFDLAVDMKMQKQALLASLPMLYGPLLQSDLKTAQRVSTKTLFNATNMMPVVAEWTGTPPVAGSATSIPVLTLFGRRGQAQAIDLFANPSGNYNGVVVGTSGSGKSFLLNELTMRTLATGGRTWIIDVGRSYEKLANLLGGQFISFGEGASISLNPFSMVTNFEEDLEILKPLVAQMISPSRPLSDYEQAQVEVHLRSVWYDHGAAATITDLAKSLTNNCTMGGPNPQAEDAEWREKVRSMSFEDRQKYCDPRIRDLGVQLFPFTEDGTYGRYFTGPANIDFKSNFIVLELEELKAKKDLQAVVMLLLMYRITQAMFIAERSQRKLVIVDEAWELMRSGQSGDFIEAGYRRARKYGGAFITSSQSIADYFKSATSVAALTNADWLFLLRQKPESIEALAGTKEFQLDDRSKAMLRSVTTVSGVYSEIFIRGGDLPPTVSRLLVDPFSALVASSRAQDFEAVRAYVKQGMPVERAVAAVLEDRASAKPGGQQADSAASQVDLH